MKKLLSIFLVLAILALFLVGCVGASRSNAGFSSDENRWWVNQQHDVDWFQKYGP
jgi:outer membrane biogenesis lipoprotein LolB